jgi:hypothetical protein
MKNRLRYFTMGMLMLLGSVFFSAYAIAQEKVTEDPLLEGTGLSRQYLLQLSGTVMNETFSAVQALLTLSRPVPGSKYGNPYLLVIEGFPKKNSRNSFFWSGEHSEMTAISNEITCDIKRTYVKGVETYFMFLSPELLRHTGSAFEGAKFAEKFALPTQITARAGKLKLRIQTDTISGNVWMKGYDPAEKSFVLYSARLYGKKSYNLQPKQEGKKGTTVGE